MVADRKQRRLQRIADRPWAIVIVILGAVLFAILAAGRGPNRTTHEAVLSTFRLIDSDNSTLQRDVLQTRAGLLSNYDSLADSIVNLHEMLARLKLLFKQADIDRDPKLTLLQDQLSAAIDTEEILVEHFKSRNALLQNSLSIFSKILTDIHEKPSADLQALGGLPDELGNLMMRYSQHPDPQIAQRIRNLLHGTSPPSLSDQVLASRLATLSLHGDMVLMTLPAVNNLVSDIQSSESPLLAQDLQQEYLKVYTKINSRAAWSRAFLGAISVLLCIYILFLVYRLRLHTDRLARRLEFEDVTSRIKVEFDSFSLVDSTTNIQNALVLLGEFLDAKGRELVIFNTETGHVEESYGNLERGTALTKYLTADFISGLTAREKKQQPSHRRFFYKNLQSHDELAFTRDSMSAGVAVGMQTSARTAAMIIFEYRESRPKASVDEVELLQNAIDVVIQCIDRCRRRRERETLERRLEHAERLQAVGTLAGGIAHEFNNILGAMLGYGEMALQILRRPSTSRRYVSEIVSAGERARVIIDQIMTLSRKRERSSRPFDMVEAVSDILPLLKVSLPDAFELSSRHVDRPAVVLGNPIEIQQILMNLCKNAAEASPDVGKIEIEVFPVETRSTRPLSHGVLPAGNYVRLSVADRGEGIPESILPHIFEPFFSTKSHAGGTGLGLAAVHGNVAALAGHIHVESGVGRGTRFELFFPVSYQTPIPLRQFFGQERVSYGKGETILLLEREHSLLMMHEEKLAALGYEPVGLTHLDEIVDWLKADERRPALVILDVASLKQTTTPTQLNKIFKGIPYLLIADQYRTGPLSEQNLRRGDMLRKPLISKNLADAIHRKISVSEDAQPSGLGVKAG